MDFITHTLIGTGAARVVCPKREWLPQVCLAGALGSLLMDGDSWVQFFGQNAYGKYHRVVSHSIPGLAATVLLAVAFAIWLTRFPARRRFGWFVSTNLPSTIPANPPPIAPAHASHDAGPNAGPRLAPSLGEPTRAPLVTFLTATALAAALHFCGDAITGFGNMTPFWPFSRWDASLHATTSFDIVIFGSTLAWHVTTRNFGWNRKREAVVLIFYLIVIAAYIGLRLALTEPTVW